MISALNLIVKMVVLHLIMSRIIIIWIIKYFQVTERIYELTTKISKYYTCPELNIDFGEIGTSTVNIQDFGPFTIQVIDSVKDYADLMEEIFDFPKV